MERDLKAVLLAYSSVKRTLIVISCLYAMATILPSCAELNSIRFDEKFKNQILPRSGIACFRPQVMPFPPFPKSRNNIAFILTSLGLCYRWTY